MLVVYRAGEVDTGDDALNMNFPKDDNTYAGREVFVLLGTTRED